MRIPHLSGVLFWREGSLLVDVGACASQVAFFSPVLNLVSIFAIRKFAKSGSMAFLVYPEILAQHAYVETSVANPQEPCHNMDSTY